MLEGATFINTSDACWYSTAKVVLYSRKYYNFNEITTMILQHRQFVKCVFIASDILINDTMQTTSPFTNEALWFSSVQFYFSLYFYVL